MLIPSLPAAGQTIYTPSQRAIACAGAACVTVHICVFALCARATYGCMYVCGTLQVKKKIMSLPQRSSNLFKEKLELMREMVANTGEAGTVRKIARNHNSV